MSRTSRICPVGIPQHIIQRGNNRQVCFACDEDFSAYAQWLHEAAQRYSVQLHAWVFMSNHVHLLVTPRQEGAISAMMQYLGRHYVRYFNSEYRRSGTLWEGRFKSCLVGSEHYLLHCQRYIELNPVRANMVAQPGEYRWSSHRAHIGEAEPKLWVPHPEYLRLGSDKTERVAAYQALFSEVLDAERVQQIRDSLNRGHALGTSRFRDEMERLTGVRQQAAKRGRKPKSVLGAEESNYELLL